MRERRSGNMQSFGKGAVELVASLGGSAAEARKAARGAQVRAMWQKLMEHNHDEFILAHTNNVYIVWATGKPAAHGKRYRDDGKDADATGKGKQLIVYVDDSAVAAELNARRELIKLQFMQHFNEDLDEFKIIISRGRYKQYHPFAAETPPSYEDKAEPVPLDQHEQRLVEEQAGRIENPVLARSFARAMEKDLAWKKGLKADSRG
ncbi:MAG: DUF721 domain-containing protein [Eggerthellaceae bacterium]|jgi:hypothetical protein